MLALVTKDGKEEPIAFASKSFSVGELFYRYMKGRQQHLILG
jgi:hypothetical protein